MKENCVYLDHCSTTPVDHEIIEVMIPYFSECFGNPSSIHTAGRRAKLALEEARKKVAYLIGAEMGEIVFTSGGTEANNLALRGVVDASQVKGNHIITTAIEHHSVINTCKYLEGKGYHVTYLPVNREGLVTPKQVKNAISQETIVVSVMHANNEIGTVEPVAEIGSLLKESEIIFHTDAVQTTGKIPVRVDELHVDLLSFSSHKIYGPKGVGALYVRKGTKIVPAIYGGNQENGVRHGTENVAAIVGFGKACEVACEDYQFQAGKLKRLRDNLEERISERIESVHINGDPQMRLPHILNVSIEGIEAEAIVREMDKRGIEISAGSACKSNSMEISHVILALGVPRHIAKGSIRFSLGKRNVIEDVNCAVDALIDVVTKLRNIAEMEASVGQRRCV